jgi:Domain of unknown function (DUF4150)
MADPGETQEPITPPTKPPEEISDPDEALVCSIAPDVCRTPCGSSMVPVPHTLWARQEDDANTTPAARMTSLRSYNMASLITTCHGDEAGVIASALDKARDLSLRRRRRPRPACIVVLPLLCPPSCALRPDGICHDPA